MEERIADAWRYSREYDNDASGQFVLPAALERAAELAPRGTDSRA